MKGNANRVVKSSIKGYCKYLKRQKQNEKGRGQKYRESVNVWEREEDVIEKARQIINFKFKYWFYLRKNVMKVSNNVLRI